ncbi:MAG TPA: hypothetical protein PLS24_06905 [Sedimentisphaerales bacterium]|nr:hypothetical protein [Sedimentisphaerales bacterium]
MVNEDLLSEELSASSVMRAMKAVVAELDRGRGVEAVRLFGDALDHGVAPPDVDLVRWLIKAIGKRHASRLIVAYAHHPCFYCKKGLETCEACKGRGHWEHNTLCETCVTTGVARCDFCDGAGLLTYSAMPPSLRLPAAIERVKLATKGLEAILQRPAPRPSQSQPHECLKSCAKRLTDINRLMGMFENALVLAKAIGESSPRSRPIVARILRACLSGAPRGLQRIRENLKCMAACARYKVEDASLAPAVRRTAKRRVVLLESLLKPSSTFAGTSLEHSFLYQRSEEFVHEAMGSSKTRRKTAQTKPAPPEDEAETSQVNGP